MKDFTKYMKEKEFIKSLYNINGNCPDIYEGNIDNNIKVCDYIKDASYDIFIQENNLNYNNDTYKLYLSATFGNFERSYEQYQKSIYENLSRSYPAEDLISKLKDIMTVDNIKYTNRKSVTQFSFTADKEPDEERFMSLLHFYNYYIRLWHYDSNNKLEITLEPYKPENISDYIYNDCKGIIYHITTAEKYNKIKNRELKPAGKYRYTDKEYSYRDKRIYFIAGKNFKEIKSQLRQIKNTAGIRDNYAVLKIDLNKYRNRLIFMEDSSADGYNAYFTQEPIPPYCIEKTDIEL